MLYSEFDPGGLRLTDDLGPQTLRVWLPDPHRPATQLFPPSLPYHSGDYPMIGVFSYHRAHLTSLLRSYWWPVGEAYWALSSSGRGAYSLPSVGGGGKGRDPPGSERRAIGGQTAGSRYPFGLGLSACQGTSPLSSDVAARTRAPGNVVAGLKATSSFLPLFPLSMRSQP